MVKKPKLVIIGYTNIDINITPESKIVLPGGAAYFAACAASLFINPVGLVTRIGYDFDEAFLLSRVLPKGVKKIKNKKTAKSIQTYYSMDDSTQRDVKLEKGVAQDMSPKDIPTDWLKSAKIIHIGTMPPSYQRKFLLYLRRKKVKAQISADTELSFVKKKSLKKGIVDNLNMADLIFLNRAEYELLKDEINKNKDIIIKLDKDGAAYKKNGRIVVTVTTDKITVKDATGAGDIFAGTFLAHKLKGYSIKKSLKEAAKTATNSISEVGINHLFKKG